MAKGPARPIQTMRLCWFLPSFLQARHPTGRSLLASCKYLGRYQEANHTEKLCSRRAGNQDSQTGGPRDANQDDGRMTRHVGLSRACWAAWSDPACIIRQVTGATDMTCGVWRRR